MICLQDKYIINRLFNLCIVILCPGVSYAFYQIPTTKFFVDQKQSKSKATFATALQLLLLCILPCLYRGKALSHIDTYPQTQKFQLQWQDTTYSGSAVKKGLLAKQLKSINCN